MNKLDGMNTFAKVVSLGSYSEAARALGVGRSAVSKAVMELEQLLGARLLDRTTRHVSPTEAGRLYYERSLDILARVEEAEMLASRLHDEPRGVLRVNGPMSFGVSHLGAAVVDFMARHPGLKIELTLTDRFVDPVEEGVDVVVRIGAMQDSSLIARRIAPARRVLAASPAYLAAHGAPATPADLKAHRCLDYGHSTTLRRWPLTKDGRTVQAELDVVFCANSGEVLRTAALAGQGIVLLPTFLIGEDLRAGALAPVLTDWPPTELTLFALYPPNRFLAAKTRLLIDFLVARFGERPGGEGGGPARAGSG